MQRHLLSGLLVFCWLELTLPPAPSNKVEEVLCNPDVILNEIQHQLFEANNSLHSDSIEADIKELEKKIMKYDLRRSNLLDALELGEFTKDEILDSINTLKALRNEDESRLNELIGIRDNIYRMQDAKIKLDEIFESIVQDIHNCSPEMKRLAIEALDIKVYASAENVEIRGVIPLELPTLAQTSGCLPFHAYVYLIPFAFSIK